MRILHAVEHQQQRLALRRFDQRFQFVLIPGPGRGVTRDDALMAQRADHAIQRLLRDTTHIDAFAPRVLLDLGQPRILAAGLDQDLADVVGVVLDGGGHGVDAGDPWVFFGHV